MPHRKLTKRKVRNKSPRRINKKILTNKKVRRRRSNKRTQKGGASEKIVNITRDIFLDPYVKYLPSTNIFMSKLENRYVNMVDFKYG